MLLTLTAMALAAAGVNADSVVGRWQTQTRGRFYLPLMRHPFCRYSYELTPGKPFDRYGLEQQAEIVAHFFLAGRGARLAQVPPKELLPFAIV